MLRFCLIIGAMKAGTTSLFAYLSQHPEISPCREKEPSFFSDFYDRGLPWYLSRWDHADREHKVLLEASTNYTKYPGHPDAATNMARFVRDHDVSLRLIYVLRHPLERIESQYTYTYARWKKRDLHDAIGPDSHLVNVSRYARQLDRYMEHFDRYDLKLVDFDDLVGDTANVLASIGAFLNVNTTFPFTGLGQPHNKSEGARIVRPLERMCLRHPALPRVLKKIPGRTRHGLRDLLFHQRVKAKFELDSADEAEVRRLLHDDMARLHEVYGVDVGKWGFETVRSSRQDSGSPGFRPVPCRHDFPSPG